jgi:hypothetical protein
MLAPRGAGLARLSTLVGRYPTDFGDRHGRTDAVLAMEGASRQSPDHIGADSAHDVADFVADLRECSGTPHVPQNTTSRRSAIQANTREA